MKIHQVGAAAGVLAVVLTVSGCGSAASPSVKATVTATVTATPSPSPSPSQPAYTTAGQIAKALDRKLASVSGVIVLNENNDSNNLLGRPNGYISAAVLVDSAGNQSDPDPGVDYGATAEMFDSNASATRRSAYIKGLLKDAPVLGSEYDYVEGVTLLRVSGAIKPSVAKRYKAAFASLGLR